MMRNGVPSRPSWLASSYRSARDVTVDDKLTNVQPSHFQVVHYQGAYPSALQRQCTNGETSDGERTDGSDTQRERAERDGANRCCAAHAHRAAVRDGFRR
jgi:hypothetical protein